MNSTKITKIMTEMSQYFIERDDEILLGAVAILSGQHVVFLGLPGTAKSMICRAFSSHIEGANYFEWLLTKFTTPDEIFGPLDLKALKNSTYRRITHNKLPEAHIAFLDEIFKPSSAILNTLLTAINERRFHNDGKPMHLPLITLFGASNELPEEGEGLQAFYDRFLLRKAVQGIQEHTNKARLLTLDDDYSPRTKMTLQELENLRREVKKVDISPVVPDLLDMVRQLDTEGIWISDRRLKDAKKVVRAYTFLNGRSVSTNDDLEILQHVFWDEPEQFDRARSIILGISNPYSQKAAEWSAILADLDEQLKKYTEMTNDVLEIYNKVGKMYDMVKEYIKKAKEAGKDTRALRDVERRTKSLLEKMQKRYLKIKLKHHTGEEED